MSLQFHSAEHADLRLGRTVIRVNQEPVYVSSIGQGYNAEFRYLCSDKSSAVNDIREVKGIDLSPVPLGFCSLGGTAIYLFRRPSRRTKQGLSHDSLGSHVGRLPEIGSSSDMRKALGNTIIGRFPSQEAAFKIVSKNGGSAPIHRNWAVQASPGDTSLLYKFHGNVGVWNNTAKRFTLHEEYAYLQETLDEEISYE